MWGYRKASECLEHRLTRAKAEIGEIQQNAREAEDGLLAQMDVLAQELGRVRRVETEATKTLAV